jgi:hypothetical protein
MDFHILSTHCRDGTDASPLQFISAERLAYLLALEAAVGALVVLVEKAPREIAEPMQP